MTITLVVADDQSLIRAGLKTLLEHDPELRVVAEASDGRAAVALCLQHRPDVVLMDIRMPVLDGVSATIALRQDPRLDATKVLMLTTFDSDENVVDSLAAGATGFVVKDCEPDELRAAVHAVDDGTMALGPDLTQRLVMSLVRSPRVGQQREARRRIEQLTEREAEVLREVGRGLTNDEIGDALFLSGATARTYVSRLLTKLDCRDRVALVVLAHQAGLV